MIIDDFLVLTSTGLYCRAGDFFLDPTEPARRAVVSHAHGDHAVRANYELYCTPGTRAIMQQRYGRAASHVHEKVYGQTFQIGDVMLCFFPAGHILGSSQVLMEFKGIRYLYTGDFKLQTDPTCEALEFVTADVLITETTFADPEVRHPDPVKEIQKLNDSTHNVLLGSYALGKAQRISKLISDYCPGRRIFLHHTIWPLHQVYESLGFDPGKYERFERPVFKAIKENAVYIVPPISFDSLRHLNLLRAFASGWKNLQEKNGLQLLISDHADWFDILELVKRVSPSEIWTLHGDGRLLREHLSEQIPVKILNGC